MTEYHAWACHADVQPILRAIESHVGYMTEDKLPEEVPGRLRIPLVPIEDITKL
jgi:hypothetical protein